MRLAEDEDVIEALAPHTAEEALARGVCLWNADGRTQHPDPARGGETVEAGTVFRVVVADEILRRLTEGRGLAQLLGDPLVRRRAGDADVHDTARPQRGDDKREERPEADIGELHEITGPDVVGMVAQERCPGLPARR